MKHYRAIERQFVAVISEGRVYSMRCTMFIIYKCVWSYFPCTNDFHLYDFVYVLYSLEMLDIDVKSIAPSNYCIPPPPRRYRSRVPV